MRNWIFIAVPLWFIGCGNASTSSSKKDTTKKTVENVKKATGRATENKELTAFAHFIAGMQDSNALASTRKNIWKSFAKNTDEKWAILNERIGLKIQGWVKENPKNVKKEPGTLFYPFAGGDFYYANLFFPKQDTTIMIGLEPCGTIFNPSNIADSNMIRYYNNLDHTMFFPHKLGFFRTKSMANDFNRGPLNGTLHTVLFYIARAGYTVHYISHFNLNNEGQEIDKLDAKEMTKKTKRIGYKVGYSLPGSNVVKELIYMSYDASDGYLKTHTGLVHWLENRNKVVTFFKAASYLMHEAYFSTIRNFVKNHTVRLLQDDSGLPYGFMLDNGFEVELLGTYSKTIKLFAGRFQPEMKKAYEKAAPLKLPFMIGYNAEFKECNMQSAVKK